jgi:DNA (cytosine-5)-methyltransferase 1
LMTAYYNEIDPYAAGWLRNLIAAGRIAAGDVDERSIREVKPDDIKAYTQCHFFAGIGVWSAALRLAGWADDRPVWTGSCPCQPFSAAGKGGGFADDRHLWPDLFRLIAECKPGVVFGEQVASKDGLAWLDLVQADLEGADYASAAVDLCAAGVGAPHIRQRLYWVADAAHQQQHGSRDAGSSGRDEHSDGGANSRLADANGGGRDGQQVFLQSGEPRQAGAETTRDSEPSRLADANGGDTSAEREQRSGEQRQQSEDRGAGRLDHGDDTRLEGHGRGYQTSKGWVGSDGSAAETGEPSGMGNTPDEPRERGAGGVLGAEAQEHGARVAVDGYLSVGLEHASEGMGGSASGPTNGVWRDADWIFCRDGKWRPVEPGTFPLVDGATSRVGRLRAYGNAIVPQVAAEVIGAWMEVSLEGKD